MPAISTSFILALLTLEAVSTPLHLEGNIRRRGIHYKAPVTESTVPVFNLAEATRDLKNVRVKYAKAARYIAPDFGLNFIDPTPYYPEAVVPYIIHGSNADTDPDADVDKEKDDKSRSPYTASATKNGKNGQDRERDPLFPGTGFVIAGTADMPLKDYFQGPIDLTYYGPLNFGSTPPQTLTFDIDTGSADLWVPYNCRRCPNDQLESSNGRRSKTFRLSADRFVVSYGSGDVSGWVATDVVSISGLIVEEQAFGAVNQVSDEFMNYPSDGLLGLGFSTISTMDRSSWFENLIREKKLAAPQFSIHLARGSAQGSKVCFGCYDPGKTTGPTSWFPVTNRGYWSISMDGLTINQSQLVKTSITAAIDTGTTLIYVPKAVADEFYAKIPGAELYQYDPENPSAGGAFYTYPCATSFSVELSFSGQLFQVNVKDFNLGLTKPNSTMCIGAIVSLGKNLEAANFAILGDVFLKSWYSTYDYVGPRVGFAPSINNEQH